MNTRKEITCVVCPIGCKIYIELDGGNLVTIEGNKCRRGEDYAKQEILDPRRVLTTSVKVENGIWPLVSVKTSKAVPKSYIFRIMKEIKKTTVSAPIYAGDIITKNIVGLDVLDVDIVATKTIKEKK